MFVSQVYFFSCLNYPLVRSSFAFKKPMDKFNFLAKAFSIPYEEMRSSNLLQGVIKKKQRNHPLIKRCIEIFQLLLVVKNLSVSQSFFCNVNEKKDLFTFNHSDIFERNKALSKENTMKHVRKKMQPVENAKPSLPPVKGNGEREYKDLLIEHIESINQWNDLVEGKRRVAVKNFLNAIGQLYLDYYQFHLEEAKAYAMKYQFLLESSIGPIISFVIKLEHRLRSADDMDDPWETACRERTNVEAFKSMFGEMTDIIDVEGIEEYMNDRRGNASLESHLIPKNVPTSHWWWFEEYR